MNVLATLILAFACFHAYVGGESHLVCKEMDKVFTSNAILSGPSHYSHNRPVKRGERGGKGEIGMKGQKGDEGNVRYDLVNKTLKEYVSENEREQELRITNLEASLATLKEQLREIARLQDCPTRYKNKCYVPMTDKGINVADGRDICAGVSGKLANIYDATQLDYLMKTLRSNHMAGNSWIDFWTGMTINPQNGEVKLSDGRRAPYLQWYPGSPFASSTYTNIVLRVHESPSSTSQFMYNHDPSNRYYILCEI